MAPAAAPISASAKALLIAGFLSTGSINTLTKKWQMDTCGKTNYPVPASAQGVCPEGEKQFKKPWTQNIQMFFGEALMLGLFFRNSVSRRRQEAAQPLDQSEPAKKAPFYIFLLPACCDILGTGVGGVGMLYISASVWQMMRGSLIIFTSLLSVTLLGEKLPCHSWFAVVTAAFGLFLIGCSAILDEGDGGASSSPALGIFFTVISQFFAATQMVVEEKFVKGWGAPPEQVVGSEGAWGILMMLIILAVMYNVPGNDGGSYENALDSWHMLCSSTELLVLILCYLVSISFFNFFGVTIAGKLSAVHRTINDALRTFIIWAVEIFVFYALGSERYGNAWKDHTWLQLLGFFFLISANLIKHKIVKLPFLPYEEAAATPAIATPAGVSLVNPPNQGGSRV
eukprot:TRINITY_DN65958_c0_g1_i1.p1 TRINITY_DN65958_c0_g1~~TRINITY_DN65958_c0_g1_i1.p1  ORF type:complete len:425 (+),score=57.60 TRINITY_DN65958_c0_g1_i1:83-1276(+)